MWKWDYEPDDLPALSEILVDEDGNKILSIGGDAVEGFYFKITEENKRLIAATPDIYECLRSIINDLPLNRDWLDPELEWRAKQALRKAEGRGTE